MRGNQQFAYPDNSASPSNASDETALNVEESLRSVSLLSAGNPDDHAAVVYGAQVDEMHVDENRGDEDHAPGFEQASAAVVVTENALVELVFIDDQTPDAQTLLEDIRQNSDSQTNFEIFVLSAEDGIDTVTATIQQFEHVAAVHIVSHGSDGNVQLGAEVLNSDSLEQNSSSFGSWHTSLTGDADILIYGCDVAATENGRTFIDSLADITGADVAASDDDTGHIDLNADWHFEFTVGDIETKTAFSLNAQQNWLNILASDLNVPENTANGTSIGFVIPGGPVTVSSILASDPDLIYDATTGKFYKAVEGDFSWANANAAAATATLNGITGQLVTIDSQLENNLVQGLAGSLSSPEDVWIGASDQNTEDDWYWYENGVQDNTRLFWVGNFTGSPAGTVYTNWQNGEPNASGPGEDFARLTPFTGRWLDTQSTISSYSYVVEWDAAVAVPSTGGTVTIASLLASDPDLTHDAITGKFYKAVEGNFNWQSANTAASSTALNGAPGQLVAIRSQYENDLVQGLAASLNNPEDVWIGASDQNSEGDWFWYQGGVQDNSELFWVGNASGNAQGGLFNNWASGLNEPSSGFNEDVARLVEATGEWRDTESSVSTNSYVVEWDATAVLPPSVNYVLTDNAGSRFAIDSATGEITVADGARLDFETDTSHTVIVEATDSTGVITNEVITIHVDNINETPTFDIQVATTFTEQEITTSADGALSVSTADVDGDGDLDLLGAAFSDDEIAWYENDGAGNFIPHTITAQATGARQATGADVDGDGDIDVISASSNDDTVAWYENDGNQNFTPRVISTAHDAVSVAATDVDGDGDIDVLSANDAQSSIVWFENDGNQNFTEHTITAAAPGASTVQIADVDGDGDVDVLSASFDDDTIAWYENDGNQNFTARDMTTSADGARSVATADVDGDGDLDVLSASETADTISWYENDGNENFVSRTITVAANGARAVSTADFDGDGDLDVLAAARQADTVAWYENDGSQNFTPHIITSTADNAFGVATGDFNNDGLIDVVSASFNDDTISWFENNSRLTTLDANPAFVEDGAAVILDADVEVLDAELSLIDNFDGASLTLARSGGVNTDDVFSFISANDITLVGSNLLKNGQPIGLFDTTTAGQLVITFTDSNGQIPGNSDVNAIMQNIAYANSSQNPPSSVTIDWTFSDGNTASAQGIGAALSANGATIVDITAVNDAPALATIEVLPALYTEGGLPVGITGNLSLADVDDINIESATVTISGNFATGEDELLFTDQLGITGNYDPATGVLTLSGTASTADYQTALHSIAYNNTSDIPSTLTRTISFEINDGDLLSNALSRDITVVSVNNAPMLVSSATNSAVFIENSTPLVFTGMTAITDVDDINIETARVAITSNFAAGEDELVFVNQSGISGNYDAGNGVLLLTGPASLSDYQAALQSIAYANTSDDPSDLTRTITYEVNDGDDNSNTITRDIEFIAINDAPTLATIEAMPALYMEGGLPLGITGNLSLADVDDTDIESATVSISGNFAPGEDELVFTDQLGITGFYNPGTGVLALSGSASVADYQTALRSVAYSNNSGNPSLLMRTVSFDINDGDLSSNTLSRNIEFSGLNNAPVLAGIETTPAAFTENDTPLVVTGTTLLSDVDDINIETARVAITGNFTAAEDELVFVNQSGISGNYDAATGVLILTGSASVADYQAAIQSVAYANSSDNPSSLTRTLSFEINDGDIDSNTVTRDITLTVVNDAPALSTIEVMPALFVEGGPPVGITGSLSLADIDDVNLESASVSITDNFAAGDELIFTDQAGIVGAYNSATGVLILTGSASVADYQTAIQSVAYANISDNPSNLIRTLSIEINDGDVDSNTVSRDIELTAVNNAPTLATIEATPALYTEGGLPVNITANLSLADIDDTNIESAVISISGNFAPGDQLLFANQTGIAGTYNATTGVLTLTGSATVADYQAALQSVEYSNTNNNPSLLQRTVSFQVNDGDLPGNTVSRDITFIGLNDAPVLAATELAPAVFTENDPPQAITGTTTVSDIDDLNVESATVAITGNFAAGEDELRFTGQSGISGNYDPVNGVLILTGSAGLLDYQAAIRSITYANSSDNPSNLTRTVSFEINDGDIDSNTVTRDIEFTATNDAPILTSIEATPVLFTEGGTPAAITGNLSLIDIDDTNIESAAVSISGNFAAGEDELIFADQSGITGLYDPVSGLLTLSGSAAIADYEAALQSVAYNNSSTNPSTLTRTLSVTVNDGNLNSNTVVRDIDVIPVNESPVVSGIEAQAITYTENSGPQVVTSVLQLADLDDTVLEQAVVEFTNGYVVGEDRLAFTNTATITGIWDVSTGTLTLSGSDTLAAYQTALRSVTYENVSDNPDAAQRTLSFSVSDAETESSPVSRDIDILPVNDPPSGADSTVTILEDTTYLLGLSDFGFTDNPEQHSLSAVIINQLPAAGQLLLNDIPVSAGQIVQASDITIGWLTFSPAENANGTPYDSLTFRVLDDGGTSNGGNNTSELHTLSIEVISVNDAPDGGDNTIQIQEDNPYVFQRPDFLYTDAVEQNLFTAITVSTLPESGVLRLAGADVSAGQLVTVQQIDSGLLIYTPLSNESGAGNNSFTFQVHDSGGNANGGISVDPTANAISFDVQGVNDAPELVAQGETVDEGGSVLIDTDVLAARDPDDLQLEELVFTLTLPPDNGVLALEGRSLTAGDTFTLAEIAEDKLRYIHDGSETGADHFDVSVADGGEDGALPASGRFSLFINEVIDPAPELENDQFALEFGASFDSRNGDVLASGSNTLGSGSLLTNTALTIEIASPPENGEVKINADGTFTYIPDGSLFQRDQFSYRITNEDGSSATATILVAVEPPVGAALNAAEPVFEVSFPGDNIEEVITSPVTAPDEVVQESEPEPESELAQSAVADFVFDVPSAVVENEQQNLDRQLETLPTERFDIDTLFVSLNSTFDSLRVQQHNEFRDLDFVQQNLSFNTSDFNVVLEIPVSRAFEVVTNPNFIRGLDRQEADLAESEQRSGSRYTLASETVLGVSISATAGALVWALRGGALIASVMASTPLWASLDPVRAMTPPAGKNNDTENSGEDGSVESMFES